MAARQWMRDDDKRFETALVQFPENLPNRWEEIAEHLKISVNEVIYYYDALDHDIKLIDSGLANVPDYPDCSAEARPMSYQPKNERKRGRPWTQEEHALFLKGLKQYKQGSWKEIARHCVKSRTATQVASHAQKYFLRQNSEIKARKRSSIHDITSVDDDEELKMH